MKIANRKLVIGLICLNLFFAIQAQAQDEPRAAWQVTSFDITVNNPGSERALNARAIVSVKNVGNGSGSIMTLRINTKAEIKSVTSGGASVTYRSDVRSGAQRLTITLPGAIAPNATTSVTVDYRLPVEDNTGVASLSPIGSQFLPDSLWYPAPNTANSISGVDYAPIRMNVTAVDAVASGVDKSAGGNSIFDQSLNALPFFIAGSWDRVDGGGSAKGIGAMLMKGAGPDERKQAESLVAFTADARSFFANLFGAAPDVPIRLVAVNRGAGFDDAGTILIGESAFRRRKIDSLTALGIAEAVGRLWLGGLSPVRGAGNGLLRESLARFLATAFLEKEFSADAAEGERARERLDYESIAKHDGALAMMTPLDREYLNSVSNKGAMVWRLVDHLIGRDVFVTTLRSVLVNSRSDDQGLTLAKVRAAIAERGGAAVKTVLDQELDQPTDMDLMAGLPHQENGQWVAALRNLGSFDVTVNVTGTTDSGQPVSTLATIPAHDFGQAIFKTASRIARVEVDPEKFYPQIDYGNDIAPRPATGADPLAEVRRLFGAQDYAKAEPLARSLLVESTLSRDARIELARVLLAENKIDEAEREFHKLAAEPLPTPKALAWSSIGLGEIALRRGQNPEAARYFNDAVRVDADSPSTIAARAGRIRAESGAPPPIDESAKTFISQLDGAIRTGRQADIGPMIMAGELKRFVQQIVGTQPESWQTRVVRSEPFDANHIALDVMLNTKQLGVEHSGTAVYILARVGGSWKLSAIEFFEVR